MDYSKDENQNTLNKNNHLKHLFDIEDDEIFLYRKSYFQQIQKKLTAANDNNLSNKRGENV